MAVSGEAGGRRRGRRPRSFAPRYPGWLTLPSFIYYAVLFAAPMAILVVFSVAKQGADFGSIVYTFDVSQYTSLWDSTYISIFWHTLLMAAGGTLVTVIVGYPVAYFIARYLTTWKSWALLLIVLPFFTSFLIRTYAWIIILDPQGSFAKRLGVTDWLFSWKAVAIGLSYNYLPLLIMPVYSALERMDWSLVEAATDLGASPFKAFREITLPLTAPGLITGSLLVFIPMTGEYVIPTLLGGGKYPFVGATIYDQFLSAQNWPFGAAMSLTLMAVLTAFVVVYIVFATKEEQFGA